MAHPTTYQEAVRKAKYGRKDWLAWTTREGQDVYSVCSKQSLKDALLATGTRGHFTHIGANDGTGMRVGWNLGLLMLRNWKYREIA